MFFNVSAGIWILNTTSQVSAQLPTRGLPVSTEGWDTVDSQWFFLCSGAQIPPTMLVSLGFSKWFARLMRRFFHVPDIPTALRRFSVYDAKVIECGDILCLLLDEAAWWKFNPDLGNSLSPKIVELFAGTGEMSMGAKYLGADHILAVDWNPKAVDLLSANHPGTTLQLDLTSSDAARQIHAACEGRPGTIFMGFPCQPHSQQGQQLGCGDSRAEVLWHGLHIAFMLQTQSLILECTPLAGDNIEIQNRLASLAAAMGWVVKTVVIDLLDVWPCKRQRWWALLFPSQWNQIGLPPSDLHSTFDSIQTILSTWGQWPFEDEMDLRLTPWEMELYHDFSFGHDRRELALHCTAATILHSYANALGPGPCGCRHRGFHLQTLRTGGLRGQYVISKETGAPRFLHPKEAALLVGVVGSYEFVHEVRTSLAMLGLVASPLQVIWISGHLLRNHRITFQKLPCPSWRLATCLHGRIDDSGISWIFTSSHSMDFGLFHAWVINVTLHQPAQSFSCTTAASGTHLLELEWKYLTLSPGEKAWTWRLLDCSNWDLHPASPSGRPGWQKATNQGHFVMPSNIKITIKFTWFHQAVSSLRSWLKLDCHWLERCWTSMTRSCRSTWGFGTRLLSRLWRKHHGTNHLATSAWPMVLLLTHNVDYMMAKSGLEFANSLRLYLDTAVQWWSSILRWFRHSCIIGFLRSMSSAWSFSSKRPTRRSSASPRLMATGFCSMAENTGNISNGFCWMASRPTSTPRPWTWWPISQPSWAWTFALLSQHAGHSSWKSTHVALLPWHIFSCCWTLDLWFPQLRLPVSTTGFCNSSHCRAASLPQVSMRSQRIRRRSSADFSKNTEFLIPKYQNELNKSFRSWGSRPLWLPLWQRIAGLISKHQPTSLGSLFVLYYLTNWHDTLSEQRSQNMGLGSQTTRTRRRRRKDLNQFLLYKQGTSRMKMVLHCPRSPLRTLKLKRGALPLRQFNKANNGSSRHLPSARKPPLSWPLRNYPRNWGSSMTSSRPLFPPPTRALANQFWSLAASKIWATRKSTDIKQVNWSRLTSSQMLWSGSMVTMMNFKLHGKTWSNLRSACWALFFYRFNSVREMVVAMIAARPIRQLEKHLTLSSWKFGADPLGR